MAEVEVQRNAHGGRAKVRLRVALDEAPGAAANLTLPVTPHSWNGKDPANLWLGPDQWLILSDTQTAEAIITDLAERLRGRLHHATDVSAALVCFAVRGESARLLLGMGSGVDFDARSFAAGRCVSTRFARIAALIRAVAAGGFELYVDRSLGDYLASWFEHACRDPLLTTPPRHS